MPESEFETSFPISVTPDAATQMKRLIDRKGTPESMIRVGVKGGGCSGLEYVLALEETQRPDDLISVFEGVTVLCDPKSARFLKGSTLEYSSNLMSGGFQFNNPNAKRSCGCGTSFTPADQE